MELANSGTTYEPKKLCFIMDLILRIKIQIYYDDIQMESISALAAKILFYANWYVQKNY